jgi:two-component system sensor histidine kinase VicK
LIHMVNELLVLTRAEVGSLQLNIQQFDLVELVRVRCENIYPLAARRKVEFKIVSASQSLHVHADPDHISQVIDNLLSNAIRHSPENSSIIFTINSQENGIECSVSDSGTGIPAKHLPFIFDRFYRVESSRDRISGGTGLGLAIARAIINAHGGKIFAESVEGAGTTITFWLPKESDIQLTTF